MKFRIASEQAIQVKRSFHQEVDHMNSIILMNDNPKHASPCGHALI